MGIGGTDKSNGEAEGALVLTCLHVKSGWPWWREGEGRGEGEVCSTSHWLVGVQYSVRERHDTHWGSEAERVSVGERGGKLGLGLARYGEIRVSPWLGFEWGVVEQ